MKSSPQFSVNSDGSFIVKNYNHSAPFSNFLPGYAGKWGKPVWAYYVNRGQCMATFGTRDKDHAILEFDSANLHYRRIFQEGFRTFIRIKGSAGVYEPFALHSIYENRMIQTAADLTITETNTDLGIKITVKYYTVPEEEFGALCRSVSIENLTNSELELEILDGIPKIVPYERNHFLLKNMPFITDGYLQIDNLKEKTPYFTLASVPTDEAETEFVEYGNYLIGFVEINGQKSITEKIVDPKLIFDEYLDFTKAYVFEDERVFNHRGHQDLICQTPCAFNYSTLSLSKGDTCYIQSLYGAAKGLKELDRINKRVMRNDFFFKKERENKLMVTGLMDSFPVFSGNRYLDQYLRQSNLDNTLRGGYPLLFDSKDGKVPFYAFSRLHGDLERDYNNFILEPTYFSCGNGRFRDVNQNRRNDTWLHPEVDIANLKHFFNLIQLDGYNPLVCGNLEFRVDDDEKKSEYIRQSFLESDQDIVREFLSSEFTPGSYANFLKEKSIKGTQSLDQLINGATSISKVIDVAEHDTGYWSDHFMYNFDMLFRYMELYPDRVTDILCSERSYTFYDSPHYIKKRNERYILYKEDSIRHLISVGYSKDKDTVILNRDSDNYQVRTKDGQIYYTTLLGKIFSLITLKLAAFSPSGLGIDMEGGRPGWCDSVNGLPSLFGSELPAQYRLFQVIKNLSKEINEWEENFELEVYEEIYQLYRSVLEALTLVKASRNTVEYWSIVNCSKEIYRSAVKETISGREIKITKKDLLNYLDEAVSWMEELFESAFDDNGLPLTFMTHKPKEYDILDSTNPKGYHCVDVKDFDYHKFAPFLEGAVFRMEYETDKDRCLDLYNRVKNSPLYDNQLNLYKIATGLEHEPKEQGRTGGWPKGWFENESVFLHVQFKYLLQLLKSGLYDEFFEDIKSCFTVFRDPEEYGRSPFEHVSFIAPTAHERPSYWGRGSQARLTGTNAEVIHMFQIMSFGHRPFCLGKSGLELNLRPILTSDMFTNVEEKRVLTSLEGEEQELVIPQNCYAALFLGKTLVVYNNPQRETTFGDNSLKPHQYELHYSNRGKVILDNEIISGEYAEDVRKGLVTKIIVNLG